MLSCGLLSVNCYYSPRTALSFCFTLRNHFLYTPLFKLLSAQLLKTECRLAWWEMQRPYRVRISSLVLILRQLNPVYTLPSHLSYILIKDVPLAAEPDWLADRCSVSQQLGALQTHTTDTFLFISHTTNVPLFKFRCNIFIVVRIIKETPGSVASGTPCIILTHIPMSSR
jgi:hypothetical protein